MLIFTVARPGTGRPHGVIRCVRGTCSLRGAAPATPAGEVRGEEARQVRQDTLGGRQLIGAPGEAGEGKAPCTSFKSLLSTSSDKHPRRLADI